MDCDWGYRRRISRLKTENYFFLLALDHALTSGSIKGLENIGAWSEFSDAQDIPALVVNIGGYRNIPPDSRHSCILQCFGLPQLGADKLSQKTITATVHDALKLGASAISVQIDYGLDDLSTSINNISEIRNHADRYDIPVLIMAGYSDPEIDSVKRLIDSIRLSAEIGADIIKVRLPTDVTDHPDKFEAVKVAIASAPPVILAGGERSNHFEPVLRKAKQAGFKGVCVGRNVFQSQAPEAVVQTVKRVFSNSSCCEYQATAK